jgi:hypothetical protein
VAGRTKPFSCQHILGSEYCHYKVIERFISQGSEKFRISAISFFIYFPEAKTSSLCIASKPKKVDNQKSETVFLLSKECFSFTVSVYKRRLSLNLLFFSAHRKSFNEEPLLMLTHVTTVFGPFYLPVSHYDQGCQIFIGT